MYFWIGLRENGQWEVFSTDLKSEGTAEETGYAETIGPFDTAEDADVAADDNNK